MSEGTLISAKPKRTVKDGAQRWVSEFNRIPQSLLVKLLKQDPEEMTEITPPSLHDTVKAYNKNGRSLGGGTIIKVTIGENEDDETIYTVELYDDKEKVELPAAQIEVDRDDFLPMWGTMWTFGDSLDTHWLEDKRNVQIMADCGFRIYEQEDLDYVFGIDGAGYDFYEQHWIPLYLKRGLQWHDE
jgi:hypothetical protein